MYHVACAGALSHHTAHGTSVQLEGPRVLPIVQDWLVTEVCQHLCELTY